jgi:hypothetical protein
MTPVILRAVNGGFGTAVPDLWHATQQSKAGRETSKMDVDDTLRTVLEKLIKNTFDKIPWTN